MTNRIEPGYYWARKTWATPLQLVRVFRDHEDDGLSVQMHGSVELLEITDFSDSWEFVAPLEGPG